MKNIFIAILFIFNIPLSLKAAPACSALFGEPAANARLGQIKDILAMVPNKREPFTINTFQDFQKEVSKVFKTTEPVHDFLWEYAQTMRIIQSAAKRELSASIWENGQISKNLMNEANEKLRIMERIEDLQIESILNFRESDKIPAVFEKYNEMFALVREMPNTNALAIAKIYETWLADIKANSPESIIVYFKQTRVLKPYVDIIIKFQKERKLFVLSEADLIDP